MASTRGRGPVAWFCRLLPFDVAEPEAALRFVPLKVASSPCLDAFGFFFSPLFLEFTFWHAPRRGGHLKCRCSRFP